MDDPNLSKPATSGLAGNIDTPAPDPFDVKTEDSESTKALVNQMNINDQVSTQPQPIENKAPELVSAVTQVLPKPIAPVTNHRFGKVFRYFLFVLVLVTVLVGTYLFLFLTNLDAQFLKTSIAGTITDSATGKAIQDAKIFVDGDATVTSDANGKYSLSLNKLTFVLKVTAKDYNDFEENVSVPRSILNYNFTKNITLTSSRVAKVKGKFITDIVGYKFTNDELFFNDDKYNLNEDGSFDLVEVPTGKIMLRFQSSNFKDIDQEVELKDGSNTINEITLTQAGDIVGSVVSYVKEDIVLKTKFEIENVLANQIAIEFGGKFRIKDLEIGKNYKIRSSADGYQTRDYEITVVRGDNELFGFKMIENGTATYIGTDANRKDHFYASDFDGANVKELEDIKDFSPQYEYFNSKDGFLYFLSSHDKVKNSFKTIDVAYSLNPQTLELIQVTQNNLDTMDNLLPNFRAKRMVNNYQIRNDPQKRRQLLIMDITGENLRVLRTITGTNNYDNIKISGNGQYVYFREGDFSKNPVEQPTVYRADSQSDTVVKVTQKKDVQIHAVSDDGNLVVYSALNETTTFRDLFLFNASTNETRTLKENHDGNQYQFLNSNNDDIIFFAKRDGENDIFLYSIGQNSTSRISSLSADDEIENLYQQEDYTFYITKKGLYVMDILKPHTFKLVTDKVTKYTN
ncbi:MAG: carboxypeptidase regulatory-like domain-containing protein [Candidatus Dojkabacteria bacterium]